MKIDIDPKSGCCHGVLRAIEQAEKHLSEKGSLYSLGSIVHNDTELERLTQKGLKIIDYDTLGKLHSDTVLIRAHGEPPSTYESAKANHLSLIDCTCPVVLKLQQKIAATYHSIKDLGGQIVIFGKKGHAEVNGLIGQVNGNAVVVENQQDMAEAISEGKIDLTRPIAIFSQTTKDEAEYEEICGMLHSADSLSIFHTICGQVSSRHPHLKEFSQNHSIVIFVSGKESSNGKILFQLCKSVNPRTYMIEHTSEIDPKWLSKDDNVGICGATSTPKWQLEEVSNFLLTLRLF